MKTIILSLIFNGLVSLMLVAQNTDWFEKGLDADDPKQQVAFFTKSIEQGNELYAAYYCRAAAKLLLKDAQGAIDDYSKCIEIDSNDVAAYIGRGKAKQDIGVNYQEAVADIVKAKEMAEARSIPIVLYNGFYPKNQDCQGVILFYNKILKFCPDDPAVCNKLGFCYLAMGDDSLAVENFNKSIALQPKKTEAYLGLALVYYYKDDRVKAKRNFKQARALNPKLRQGQNGFESYKKEGYRFSDRDNEALKKMFARWK